MRHSDFAPLYRSTIGFDRLVQMLDAGTGAEDTGYPPYNIERLSENTYRITMAVAGFSKDEINVELKEQSLTVRGEKAVEDSERHFLHRGIAARTFERRFQLADYVEVVGAHIADGLLHVELARNLPDRMRPRTIEIGATPTARIESSVSDADSVPSGA